MINQIKPAAMPPQAANDSQSAMHNQSISSLQQLLAMITNESDAESMQSLIQRPDVLKQAKDAQRLIGVSNAQQLNPRLLLTALLVSKFPEIMFGSEPTQEEAIMIVQSRALHERLVGLCESRTQTGECLQSYMSYTDAFESWQKADQPSLVDALIARYMDLFNALSALNSQSPDDHDQTEQSDSLRQQITELQQQIRQKLQRVGGVQAMSALEELLMRSDPVRAVHMAVPSVPVAALVHELCFNRHFELIRLIEEYNGVMAEPRVTVASDDDVLQFIEYLQTNLLPIIPAGTRVELQPHLEKESVTRALQTNQFDLNKAIELAVNVMASSCAPIRDDDISQLRQLHASRDTDKAVSRLVRVVDLMRLDFFAYALCQQRPVLLNSIVQYERQYFKDIPFGKGAAFLRAHPDWSEWPFLADFEEIETVQFDRKRVREWRLSLLAIIQETAFETIHRKNPNIERSAVSENNSVVRLLQKRLQAAIRESVGPRTKEALRSDGFSVKDSVILHDILAEIQHFMPLHLAIHEERYKIKDC